ncbi:MAG: undecaprenyl/decaprenyl-phosphate alpha-N-acetylglucosaminyl 1-phosphate transferase [Candidatus Omnitrophica bacterium]|nr:undecaprenyl/decaprenyl-phosphate alpha-N-acetylglucosaminyl 1-phosphate transferase [Candidatus Omnitrophota bacterium]MCF7891836.1 undecaprenyl/decaprenyl-phosphate alpha-N-acetylglucosaminyl 1-phosphate transferase [Candidatus Omnitrophota bacterium]MCF7895541.1 undecaprenyl/decaprenyl-phosphate alpha-N-acetylglucosaminyl 1-phosphate transferase [Candidatus Omnitrophota bacterium]MCF7897214.1 undecaprenyl/decaprenyl-phosphate alpha-N-acetylglucosaminyl 1-phosphate transferase [Candidatus O
MVFFIFSFLMSLSFPALFKKFLSKTRLSSNKEKPMFLGISIYLASFIVFLLAKNYYKLDASFLTAVFAGASFILLLGVWDDIKNLSVKTKLIGQIAAAFIAIFMGVRTSIVYFPDWLNLAVTLVWILALVNAFNFLDIMDGLCVGVSLIVSFIFLAMSIVFRAPYSISVFFWVLSGALLGAFIYNKPVAKFYLGDSGSMLIGFIFACSTMEISYAPDTSHSLALFAPVLIVILPVYDLFFTVFMRWRKGKAISKKSGEHFALMLKEKGFSARKILVIIYAACLLSGLSAFLLKALPLYFQPWFLGFVAMVILILSILFFKVLKTND